VVQPVACGGELRFMLRWSIVGSTAEGQSLAPRRSKSAAGALSRAYPLSLRRRSVIPVATAPRWSSTYSDAAFAQVLRRDLGHPYGGDGRVRFN